MPASKKIIAIAAVGLLLPAIVIGIGQVVREMREAERLRIEVAFKEFLPNAAAGITNKYHARECVFTDSVERYRFDGADKALVEELVRQFELKDADSPLRSDFNEPKWWALPEHNAKYFLRGSGHQYFQLIYQPDIGRVFFERTQS